MARLTYTTRLLLLGPLALAACPRDDVPTDTGSTSSGDESTTGDGTTTTPPTTDSTSSDSSDSSDSTSTGAADPCADVECRPGEECIDGTCVACGRPTCETGCAAGETCECPPDDPCCDVGMCVPPECPADPLVGNYAECLLDGTPDGTPCDGAACIIDNDTAPEAGVCMAQGCDYSCQCPPHPGTGNAFVTCEDITGDDVNDCWIDCQGGATCPDGMSCFGSFICLWSDADETPLYGDCFNGPLTCENGGFCVGAGASGAYCSVACGDVGDCQPPPATGDAAVSCDDVTMDGMAECWLDCSAGQACPDDMVCFMDFICLFPEILPPGDNYGDCINWPGGCNPDEDACVTDAAGGVCSQTGCVDAMGCPVAPATGNAVVACGDLGNGNTCYLDCGMGETCPDGMVCFTIGMNDVCVWPDAPEDLTCVMTDLGSATGMAVAMGTTTGAGNDFTPSCGNGGNDADVALRWTAPADATYTFDTLGSVFDTILMIFPDCSTSEVACNDDFIGLQSQLQLEIPAGQSVLIVIDGWNANGNYVLNID